MTATSSMFQPVDGLLTAPPLTNSGPEAWAGHGRVRGVDVGEPRTDQRWRREQSRRRGRAAPDVLAEKALS
jgi:hypothetical protein